LPQHANAQLSNLSDVARTTIQVAAREGAGTATIVLSPPELGHVQIRLHYSEGGVTASVVADRPEAAQALVQTTGELRRALESQGLTVHGLDVSHAGPDPERGSQRDPATPQQTGLHEHELEDEAEEVSIDASTLPLADSQVDVLA
jgi:flagellar hook-length control protein FliK